jgi:squalene cyclase
LNEGLDSFEFDPWRYVESLQSPIGAYLKRAVFKQGIEADLRERLHRKIVADQSADGSWKRHFVPTANNLWNLCLLGYDAKDSTVKKGLDWLLSIQKCQYRGYPGFFQSDSRADVREMRSIIYGEFGPGCAVFYQTTYAVHLFLLFGFGDNQRIQTAVKSYLQFWKPDWCGAWCTINVLRVLIEHPVSAGSEPTEKGIRSLARAQTKQGSWRGYPFYHTFHALSRAEQPLAKKQVKKALRSLVKRQNADGSWGARAPETESFLVLDALKNAGYLQGFH